MFILTSRVNVQFFFFIRRITRIKYILARNNVVLPGALNIITSISLVLNAAFEVSGGLPGPGPFTNVRVRGPECTLGAFQLNFADLKLNR